MATVEVLDSALRQGSRRSQGALWRTLLCTLAAKGARDLVTGATVITDGSDFEAVSLALAHWSTSDDSAPLHQRALGYVLALTSSLDELRAVMAGQRTVSQPAEEVLASQYLPSDPLYPPRAEAFADLLRGRQQLLAKFLAQNGIKVVHDQLASEGHPA